MEANHRVRLFVNTAMILFDDVIVLFMSPTVMGVEQSCQQSVVLQANQVSEELKFEECHKTEMLIKRVRFEDFNAAYRSPAFVG